MEKKVVLITGIGGNVGQGVLRNIKSIDKTIRLIGTDISNFTAGNHLCDKIYQVPYSYDSNYLPCLQKIIENEKVNLIIPTTDYEVYYLSLYKNKINTTVIVSDIATTENYLDKYLTYKYHKKINAPFAKSWLPSEFKNHNGDIIIKPRKGRGSRGIVINPQKPKDFSDKYIIQPLIKGIEITTAIYVNKQGKLHDLITLQRDLENGTTVKAKTEEKYNKKLLHIIEKMLQIKGIKGSLNIQSIVTESEEIVPFEINCRISGTNSIRHNFGFQDTKYILQEYLYNVPLEKSKKKKGIAVRILTDVIYYENNEKNLNSNSNFKLY